MVAHPLIPCVTRWSATIVLTIQNKSTPSMRKWLNCLCHFRVDIQLKMLIHFCNFSIQFSRWSNSHTHTSTHTHIQIHICMYFLHTANISKTLHRHISGNKIVMYMCANQHWTNVFGQKHEIPMWHLYERPNKYHFCVNSSPPSVACIRQLIGSALVQIMACRLFGAKPSSKLMLGYCQLDFRNKLRWLFNQNSKHFIHENASEITVSEMAAILSKGRWMNQYVKGYSSVGLWR